jgi:uncharacterized protein (TIGR01319 family)
VLAGNVDVREDVATALTAHGTPVISTDNVLPRIGALHPGPARAAIRDVFLRHVIGGKRLSRGPRFASLVRGATPDVVLTGVELLADHLAGDLLVVDVGGATTDVYSVLQPDSDEPSRDVAGTLWRSRTVEGDLGMRWSATGVVTAAIAERLVTDAEAGPLGEAAARRGYDPSLLASTNGERAEDAALARLAAVVALRRHARGKDLRSVRLMVGSGGVLRYADPAAAEGVLTGVLTDHAGGWPLPRAAVSIVDRKYVLAPAGLLAADHPGAAIALLRAQLAPAMTI